MNYWGEIPFVRILFPFLAGILLAVHSQFYFEHFYLFPLIPIFLFSLLNLSKKFRSDYQWRWVNGILLNSIFFLTGILFTQNNTDKFNKKHFSRYLTSGASFAVVQISEPLTEKEKSYKAVVRVKKIIAGNEPMECEGKAMLYLKKDEKSQQLKYGDLILIQSKFKEIHPPQNPNEFDYRKYLSYHNIYQSAYLNTDEWNPLHLNHGNFILNITYHLRNFFFRIIKQHLDSPHELAVGSALILGYMDYIDDQIIHAYSSTGAMHVLSVSGLHVGIIFLVLNLALKFLDKRKWGRIFKTIFIVLFIWTFTLITGSATATVRAAIMLSLIVIGMAFSRTINIYNIIACSAFFMLCFNPYFIMDVGFQLSYLAMIGLVTLQPKIYELLYFKNWLADKTWAIIAVSFAAQIATFPLGFLYFHQFPNYFLLSNLIVVPLSALILYGGILLFLISKITILAYWVGKGLYWLIFALNWSMFYIEKMPYALSQGISITILETWFIYFSIVFAVTFYFMKKPKFLLVSMAFLLILFVSNGFKTYLQLEQKKLIIYNIPKTSAIEFLDGQSNLFLSDTALTHDDSKMLFHIKHNWWENGIKQTLFSSLTNSSWGNSQFTSIKVTDRNYVQFYNKRIMIADKHFTEQIKKIHPSEKIKIDYCIVSGNPKIKLQQLKDIYEIKEIIFDSSNADWQVKKWKNECALLKINSYSVKEKGAKEILI